MSEILCIVDGMTDPAFVPSHFPTLSSMVYAGDVDTTCGSVPESLGCILRLLGTHHVPAHLRSYAEALGTDVPVGKRDLVLRGSWFSVDESGRCTRPVQAPEKLPVDVPWCSYYPMEGYKSLLVFPGMADQITQIHTHAPYDCAGKEAKKLAPEGSSCLRVIFVDCLREDRCLILWGQAVSAELPPYPLPAAVVCGTAIVRGIARLLGMTLLTVPGATGDTDTDLSAKVVSTLKAAEEYPFVLLHINGTDEAAHRRDRAEKTAFLRKVDEVVLSALVESGHQVKVVCDHGTDPETGLHLGGLQPMYTNSPER